MTIPEGFKDYLLRTMPEEVVKQLVEGLQDEPEVSIRLKVASQMRPEGADGQVPWCPEGFYLKERPVFTADPLWHAGCYYVQEASSMFLAHVVRSLTLHPALALDLCAAPGGKSTLLRGLLPDDCLLVSNEPVRPRCQVLAENMAKWGHPEVVVTNAYAADIARACLKGRTKGKNQKQKGRSPASTPPSSIFNPPSSILFDLILADVPCSGEGMMRKEAEAVAQWSPALVADCAALQRSIVADIWPALRPGGILIYSTCTFNPDEDEDNVAWIARELGADVLHIPVDPDWGILGDLRKDVGSPIHCYHFLPGRVRGEGFFCAVLRKHGDAEMPGFIEKTAHDSVYFRLISEHATANFCELLPTMPTDLLDHPAPDVKRGDTSQPVVARVDLSLNDAFRYLRGESLVLPPDTPRGFVQVCFRGQRLGLMKNLGTRANNLYPKEWRIRSSYIEPHCIDPNAG